MVYDNIYIINQLKQFLKSIFKIYKSSSSSTLNIENLSIKNNLIDVSNINEPLKSIFQIILSTAKNCDAKFADGYYLFLYKLYNKLNNIELNKDEVYDKNNISFLDLKNYIIDIENNIDNNTKEAIQYSLLNMNRNSRISVEKSINDKYILKFSDGFKFICKEENLFFKNKIINEPYIIIIDGYIETISEINILLESAAKNKDNIIIICRGANNDIINTINLNLKRNTLNVNLSVIPFNENTLNTLKDIAICTNSEENLISIDKGNTIRSVNDYKNFSKVDQVIFENNSITFINEKINMNSILSHIRYLEEKCFEYSLNNNETLLEIFLNRLSSLNSRQTILMIPEKDNLDNEINIINNILRKIAEITKFGAVKINNYLYSSKCDSYTDESLEFIFKYINNISYIIA